MSIHYFPPQGGGGGSGTITGGANVGGGAGVFKDVSGSNLRFRSLLNNSYITWTENANDITGHVLLADVATVADNVTGSANTFAYFDPAGDIGSIPGWTTSASPINTASNVSLTFAANNLAAGPSAHAWNLDIAPLQDSPNDSATVQNIFSNLDSAASGFDFGDAGNSVTLLNIGYNYLGNGSVYGRTNYVNCNATVGNGTDPVTLEGHSMFNGFWNVAANATIDGGIQGFTFSPSLNASTTTTTNTGATAFSDTAQLPVAINGYQSFNASPTIGTINNNSGYNGISLNPTISGFSGNANATSILVNGSFSGFGSGGYTGVTVNPNLNTIVNNNTMMLLNGQSASGTGTWTGLQISDNAINTSGTVKGLQINVDEVNTAIDSSGHHSLSSPNTLASSLGQTNGNVIGGSIVIPDATAITGTDAFGNNFAFTMDLGDATSSYVSASGLVGLTNVGFVGAISGDGTADLINFCLAGYQNASTGTIDRVNNFYAAAIPAGGGTINESVLFLGNYPFGSVATDAWGIRIEDTAAFPQNYLPRLAMGDITSKKVVDGVKVEIHQDIDIPTLSEYYAIRTEQSLHVDANTTVSQGALYSKMDVAIDTGVTVGGGILYSQCVVNRTDVADLGTIGVLAGNYNVLTHSSGGITNIYSGFVTGTHSISGAGTIVNMYDFNAFGSSIDPGIVTNRYGIVIEPDSGYVKKNWLSGQLVVAGSSASPTNASCGIELAGTESAVLLSRLTTTERDALTAVNGMEIYNSTTDTFQDYTGGSWTDRGGSGMFTTSVSAVSSDITLANKVLYLVDTSSARILTLPPPVNTAYIVIKDATGSANTNPIALTPDTIDTLEVQTLTFQAVGSTGASDYIVIYDQGATPWAVALDTTGADADPTGAGWAAVAGANRIKVDISATSTAADVAAAVVIGLNSLTGFTAVITLDDSAADGSMTATQINPGPTTDPEPHNFDDSGAGSITGVETIPGVIGEKIDTVSAVFNLDMDLGSWTIISDGTDWFII